MFVLMFDIPLKEKNLKLKVNRTLRKENFKMIQKSVWSSKDLDKIIKLATWIKLVGGKARIMEEKLIFE